MKKNLFLLMIIIFMLPFIFVRDEVKKEPKENKQTLKINIYKNHETKNIDLESYIIGVVAGEMPASFNIEALKAQAVAARTYALYRYENNKVLKTDTSEQVYIDKEEMKRKWAENYEYYYNKIKNAVLNTKSEVITYKNKPILAYYFAISNGNTQDSEYVFKEYDYLKKAESIYDNESINDFKTNFTYTRDDFINKLNISCETITINYIHYNNSNYVQDLSICNKVFKGNEFRTLLGIKSPAFEINVNDNVNITTYGYGHGVGMSQYGANGYANHGLTYKQILKHYYKNTKIKKFIV